MNPFLLLLALMHPLAAATGTVCLDFSSFTDQTPFTAGSFFTENSIISTVPPGVGPGGTVTNGIAIIGGKGSIVIPSAQAINASQREAALRVKVFGPAESFRRRSVPVESATTPTASPLW